MIIILSPAKTFNRDTSPYDKEPYFLSDAIKQVTKLKRLSHETIMKKMHVSETLARSIQTDYAHFNELKTAAIHGYNGHQFKNLDVKTLEQAGLKDQIKAIYMLSGLYGIVNAYDAISPYRLEMKDKSIENLYTYWKPKLRTYFGKYFSNEMIYNLASEEYGKLIKDFNNVITIQFYILKSNKLSIHAMEAKRIRGLFTNYIIKYPHVDLKGIKLDGYTFSLIHSNTNTYTYIKVAP